MTKETKAEQEAQVLELFKEQVDFVVLARYMQILSADFVSHYEKRIINIHHSFLPAFVGANPYKHAYERGVKLIGATAHYVTEKPRPGTYHRAGRAPRVAPRRRRGPRRRGARDRANRPCQSRRRPRQGPGNPLRKQDDCV